MESLSEVINKAFRTFERNKDSESKRPGTVPYKSPEFLAYQRAESVKAYCALAEFPAKRWGNHVPSLPWRDGDMPTPEQYFTPETLRAMGDQIQKIYAAAKPSQGAPRQRRGNDR